MPKGDKKKGNGPSLGGKGDAVGKDFGVGSFWQSDIFEGGAGCPWDTKKKEGVGVANRFFGPRKKHK